MLKWTGWPISRVSYLRSVTGPEAAIIHLGTPLPAPSSGLPGRIGRAALKRVLYGLAPGGVYLADPVTRNAGGLLHHLFTLTDRQCSKRITVIGGFFSVALACGFPRVGVTHHPALRSPDFPRWLPQEGPNAIAWPTRPASMLPSPPGWLGSRAWTGRPTRLA